MGAAFFAAFLAVVFLVALCFIAVSIPLLVVWRRRKRAGKNAPKWGVAILSVFLAANIAAVLLPLGFVVFLRTANNEIAGSIVYAESGLVVYWPMGEYEPTTTWFEMNGSKYVEFPSRNPNTSFYLDYSEAALGKPLANIRYRPRDNDGFNDFMWILLSGKTFENSDENISTVYPVANEKGFDVCYVRNSPGSASMAGGTYCTESELDSIQEYYANLANYDMQNLVVEEVGESASKGFFCKEGVFEALYDLHQSAELLEMPAPDSKEVILYSCGKDGLTSLHVRLGIVQDRVYVVRQSGQGSVLGYPLPDEINRYIIELMYE